MTQSLADNKVVIRFNDRLDGGERVDLTGFGSNDRIIIDVDTYIDNLGISSSRLPFTFSAPSSYVSHSKTKINYPAGFGYTLATKGGRSAASDLELWFGYFTPTGFTKESLADWTSPISIAQSQLNFIGLAGSEFGSAGVSRTHVVVEQSGAFIDIDRNGIRATEGDTPENTAWNNANLADEGVDVTIRFNAVPATAIDLTGFNAGDEIDINLGEVIPSLGFSASAVPPSGATGPTYIDTRTYAFIHKAISGWIEYVGNYDVSYIEATNYTLRISGSKVASGPSSIPLAQISVQDLAAPTNATQVLVTESAAFVDGNSNGVWDSASEAEWNGSSLRDKAVTIRFNAVPDFGDGGVDLTGFGDDDQIEIAVASIIDDLGITGSISVPTVNALTFTSSYGYSSESSAFFSFSSGLRSRDLDNSFYFSASTKIRSWGASGGLTINTSDGSWDLASWDSAIDITRDQVSFVDLAPAIVRLVVPHGAAPYVDLNSNDVSDSGEAISLISSYFVQDLSDDKYTLHITGVPSAPLAFTGFGADDRIEIDVEAFSLNVFASGFLTIDGFSSDSPFIWLGNSESTGILVGLPLAPSLPLTIRASIASDPFPIGSFAPEGSHIPSNSQVRFVGFNYQVVVGTAQTYIDLNDNHAYNAGTDWNISNWSTVSNPVDFFHDTVTVHFDDVPDGPPLDLTGFGADDSIEIDVQAFFPNFATGPSPTYATSGNFATNQSGFVQFFGTLVTGITFTYVGVGNYYSPSILSAFQSSWTSTGAGSSLLTSRATTLAYNVNLITAGQLQMVNLFSAPD